MATFSQFLKSIYKDAKKQPDEERFKGLQFERFVKWFLTHDPEWKTQVDEVWQWDEYPKSWGNKKALGTDLIFKDKNGELWAVQAKCYAKHNEIVRRHIKWNTWRRNLREYLAHLVDHIKRRICGIASAGSPWFSV